MAKLPLSGIRVLDLSHLLPGPFLTLMLADLGAEVIKIEKPPYGDLNRRVPPYKHGMSTYFMMLNRNKKSRMINLKTKKGKETFLKLAKKADILVENFRPGVMKRLGFDYKTLKKKNKKLIYCAITGYGQKSPWKDTAGHDLNYIGLTGILEGTSYKKQRPAMLPTQLADIAGGSLLPAISILAALQQRQKTGEGIFIDSAMVQGTVPLLTMILGKYFVTGEELYQENDRMTGQFPNYTLYETKDKRHMVLAAIEPKFWNRFCEVIKKPEFKKWIPLSDPPGFPSLSLATKSNRVLTQMKAKIQKVFRTKPQKAWIKLFKNEPDCCCTPVNNLGQAVEFLKEMGQSGYMELKDHRGDRYPQWLFPWGNPGLSRRKHTLPPKLLSG